MLPPDPTADRYIYLNGSTAQIQFTGGAANLCDWGKSWSLGISLEGLADVPGDLNKNLVLFASGGTSICLKRGGAPDGSTNWGLQVTCANDLYNAANRVTANTWASPTATSRLLFVYAADQKMFDYWLGEPGGAYARKSSTTVPDAFIAAQILGDEFYISRPFTGVGGANFSGFRLGPGGVKNFAAAHLM